MANYYKNYETPGIKFNNSSIVTEFILPRFCSEELLQFVIQIIRECEGVLWNNPLTKDDGSISLYPVTFESDEYRTECCEIVESIIEQQSRTSFKLNVRSLFIEYQLIQEKIRPIIEYIENNGGWCDIEQDQFAGYDALADAIKNKRLNDDEFKALILFGNFMTANVIGKQFINVDESCIVPNKIEE